MTDVTLAFRFAAGTIVLLVSAEIVSAESLSGSRPSIILVMTDDQGLGDLSCMGNKVLRTLASRETRRLQVPEVRRANREVEIR